MFTFVRKKLNLRKHMFAFVKNLKQSNIFQMFSSQSGGGVGCILGLKVGVEILKNQEKTSASL